MLGKTISHYKVLEKIGEGGMGVVYRATDTKLNRDVALKILPEQFASDTQRMGRFQREAEVLASLDHPNIGQIYGIEDAGETKALVLQLIEGPTLADKIAQGPIPVEDALKIALQMAEGLEAAHEKGVIHRDLKPANIKITPEGQVKILDFGLAKALEAEVPVSSLSQSPTLTNAATQVGVILGTAAYMSPEQAMGKTVDKRADIFAFGAVLYECLTGKRVFEGETITETIASVLKSEPDWEALPVSSPGFVRFLLRRALQKDPSQRLRDIGDARLTIEEVLDGSSEPWSTQAGSEPRRGATIAWVLAGVLAVVAAVSLWQSGNQTTALGTGTTAHFEIALPGLDPANPFIALSPRGRHLVYVGSQEDGPNALYYRSLGDTEIRILPGTKGAVDPFFSPDGAWVGFYAEGELRKVPLDGGPAETICKTPEALGASWSMSEFIVFGSPNGLFKVPSTGGVPTAVSTPDLEKGETSHAWPWILPDGNTVLFTVWTTGKYDDARIDVLSLETGQRRTVLEHGSAPQYSATGHLLYARSGILMGVPFDLKTQQVTGDPKSLLAGVHTDVLGEAHLGLSELGTLAYLSQGAAAFGGSTLVWVDRQGRVEPVLPKQEAAFVQPTFSPSGEHVALVYNIQGSVEVWRYDLSDGRLVPIGSGGISEVFPVWSPDEQWIAVGSNKEGQWNVFRIRADGSGQIEQLTFSTDTRYLPTSWSLDDVLAIERGPDGKKDILVLDMREGEKVLPVLVTESNERGAKFSPDGKWMAFTSDRTGNDEVWIKAYPGSEPPALVSIGGGKEPVWSRDGKELFYRIKDKLMVVPVTTQPAFRVGTPTLLFEGSYTYGYSDWSFNYDVAADGSRFMMVKEGPTKGVHVLVNWFEELKRLVPTN